jgi:hypothetical protein
MTKPTGPEDFSDDQSIEAMYAEDDCEDMQFATGWLACAVLDLCCEKEREQLSKADFVRLAEALACILLAASAHDSPLIDVRNHEAAEHAVTIHQIWQGAASANPAQIG